MSKQRLIALPIVEWHEDTIERFGSHHPDDPEPNAPASLWAVSLDEPKIFVNPFGTESYGVAMLIGAEKGGGGETYAWVYEKRTKRAELSGPFDTPI